MQKCGYIVAESSIRRWQKSDALPGDKRLTFGFTQSTNSALINVRRRRTSTGSADCIFSTGCKCHIQMFGSRSQPPGDSASPPLPLPLSFACNHVSLLPIVLVSCLYLCECCTRPLCTIFYNLHLSSKLVYFVILFWHVCKCQEQDPYSVL